MNIDAYLHQVHSANARLKDVVDSVKEVVSEGIEKKIEEIRRVILFDKKLATAHVWSVEKFVEEESKAVSQQGRRVHEMVKEVENSLQVKEGLKYLLDSFILYLFRGFTNRFLVPTLNETLCFCRLFMFEDHIDQVVKDIS